MGDPKDDSSEKLHEPYPIDLGKLLGLDKPLMATVVPEQQIANEGGPIVCARVLDEAEERTRYRVPGSVQLEAQCGHKVWLAPSAQRVAAFGKNPVVCMECFMKASGPKD